MDFSGIFTPRAIAAYFAEAYTNRINFIAPAFFSPVKQAGLDLTWFKGSNGATITLMPSAFDAKATFRDRVGVTKIDTEMPFFREGYHIGEKDRQELLRVQSSNDPYAVAVINRIFDDVADLIAAAGVARERMAMQLLFPVGGDVGINIAANGVQYTYNYDPDGTWKANNYFELTDTAKWDAPSTSDPIATLETVASSLRGRSGAELKTAVMNTATFNNMAKSAALIGRSVGVPGLSYATTAEIRAAVSRYLGINVVVYDKQYRDESKVAHGFIPNGYVAFVPDGELGKMFFGTTPEEADLLGSGRADVSIVDTGVAITREIIPHPVNTNIFASEICLPSYERMDDVACIKVY